MISAWTDLFSQESSIPVVRIEQKRSPMDEMIKGLAIICTWYNSRLNLNDQTIFTIDDFKVVSFDEDEGDWSLTVVHRNIQDHYFLASYNITTKITIVAQYERVAYKIISDEDLEMLPHAG